MDDPPLTLLTKSASVYEHLRRLTVRGELRLGRRLSPYDLARSFRISETPVRAALTRLAVEGFIEAESNHGYFTKPWTVEEQRDLLGLLAVHYLWGMESVGPEAWAAIHNGLDRLDQAASASGTEPADGVAFAEIVERHFERVADLSGNAAATKVVRNATDRTHRLRAFDMEVPALRVKVAATMRDVAEAAEGGDFARARQVGTANMAEIFERLPALVARANREAQALKFP